MTKRLMINWLIILEYKKVIINAMLSELNLFVSFLFALFVVFSFMISCISFPVSIDKKRSNFAFCKLPTRQSPILLSESKQVEDKSILLRYSPVHEIVENKGHTIEVAFKEDNQVIYDNRVYKLLQFHFHTPAEHSYKENKYPMEIHLVHQSDDGFYLVIAIFFKEGNESSLLNLVLQDLNSQKLQKNTLLDLGKEFNSFAKFFHYSGSLTTSPYTEGVEWFISESIQTASLSQIKKIHNLEGYNARKLQNDNKRVVSVVNGSYLLNKKE